MKYMKISSVITLFALIMVLGCKSSEEKYVDHIEQGKNYLEKGDYKEAEIEFKNALQNKPEQTEIYEKLGDIYLKQGNTKEAFASFSRVVKLDPDNLDARLKLATFYSLGNQNEKARKVIEDVLSKEQNNTDAMLILAAIEERMKQPAEAEKVYNKIISIDNKKTLAHLGLARLKIRQKEYSDAEKILIRAVEIDQGKIPPRLGLFYFYVGRKEFDKAKIEIEKIVEDNPSNADLAVLLGDFYFMLRKKKLTLEAYIRATEIDPENIKYYLVLAGFYDSIREKDKALKEYSKALELQPDNTHVKYAIARFHINNRNLKDAETYIDKILENKPNHLNSKILKGKMFIYKGLTKEALTIYSQLAVDYPNSAEVHYNKGLTHYFQGKIRLAKQDLIKAVDLNRNHVEANLLLSEIYLSERDIENAQEKSKLILSRYPNNYRAALVLGNTFLYQNKWNKAEKIFKYITTIDSKNPTGYSRLGYINRLQKKDELAVKNLEEAISLNPNRIADLKQIVAIHVENRDFDKAIKRCDEHIVIMQDRVDLIARILHLKGTVYLANEDRKKGIEALEEAMDTDPKFTEPYYTLARIDVLLDRDIENGIDKYKVILEKDPKSFRANMILAIIYEMQKKYDEAIYHYRKILDLDIDSSIAKNNLAYRLAEKKESLNEALTLAQEAKEKNPNDPQIMDTLGWVYYKKGLHDLAINELLSSVKILPDNPDVHYHLGLVYFEKGETNSAKESLKRALKLNAKFDKADHARQILSSLDSS